jgi:hypothetical protein
MAVRNEFNVERCEVVCDVLSRIDFLLVKINFNYRAVCFTFPRTLMILRTRSSVIF